MNAIDEVDIVSKYTKVINDTKFYIYIGPCNGILTKWITVTEWDFTLRLHFQEGEMLYIDSKGQTMFCYETDEEEWETY